jgi:hypothetical protein
MLLNDQEKSYLYKQRPDLIFSPKFELSMPVASAQQNINCASRNDDVWKSVN